MNNVEKIWEVRNNPRHCRWPSDPDTVERLDRVIKSSTTDFPSRPRFSPLVLLLSVSLMIGAICGLVWMAITQ